jgi:hypothetical protein
VPVSKAERERNERREGWEALKIAMAEARRMRAPLPGLEDDY